METEINEFYQCITMVIVVTLPLIGAILFQLWDAIYQKNRKNFKNK
jgi:hypothetical protein